MSKLYASLHSLTAWLLSSWHSDLTAWAKALVSLVTAALVYAGGVVTGPYGFLVGIGAAVWLRSWTDQLVERAEGEDTEHWLDEAVSRGGKYLVVIAFFALVEAIYTSNWSLTVTKYISTWFIMSGEVLGVLDNLIRLKWIRGRAAKHLINKLGLKDRD